MVRTGVNHIEQLEEMKVNDILVAVFNI